MPRGKGGLFLRVVLGVLWACAAASAQEDPLAVPLAEARRSIDAGHPEAAIETLRGTGALSQPRVAHLMGVAYYHANQPMRAIETLTPILDGLPPGPARREIVQVLGLSNYLAGRIAEAIPFLEQTRTWARDNSELAYVLGMSYIQTRQVERARQVWAGAFGVPPDSAAGHLVTGQMMVRAELDELAETELKAALALEPRLPRARFLLGQSALFRGRVDEAIELLKAELELNPADPMALYRLGDAYLRRRDLDEAIQSLQRSVWMNPFFSGPYVLLGQAYDKKGDAVAAEGMLRRAIQYDPNNKTAHYLLGRVLQKAGRGEEAQRELETAERLEGVLER